MSYRYYLSQLALLLASALALSSCGGGGGGDGVVAPTSTTRQATLTTTQEAPAPTLPDPAAPALGGAASNTSGGTATFSLDPATNKLSGSMTLTGFASPATDVGQAHIHDGTVGNPGNVVVALEPDAAHVVWSIPATAPALTADQAAKFTAGALYVNAHTTANGPGLVRGQLISFAANVQSIFTANCLGCHFTGTTIAPMSLAAGASFGNLVGTASTSPLVPGGGTRVIAFDSADSILYRKVSGSTAGPRMPFASSSPLPTDDQNMIKVWIDMGANNN